MQSPIGNVNFMQSYAANRQQKNKKAGYIKQGKYFVLKHVFLWKRFNYIWLREFEKVKIYPKSLFICVSHKSEY